MFKNKVQYIAFNIILSKRHKPNIMTANHTQLVYMKLFSSKLLSQNTKLNYIKP